MRDLDQEINQYKHQLMQQLENEFQTKQAQLQQDLNKSWTNAENKIQQMIGAEFMILAQKILAEWSTQNTADQLLLLFDKKLHTCSKTKKAQMQKILLNQKSVHIISATSFTKKQQDLFKRILHKYFNFPDTIRLQFKHQSDLILGLEMRMGDFILNWSLNTYLDQIRQNLSNNISTLIIQTHRKVNK